MAISTQLLRFKASGVYSIEINQSQILRQSLPSLNRLLVGYSKKGPFNNPIFISNTQTFIDLFGAPDSTLESRGSYFHRMALQMLEQGPILALNIWRLNDGQDNNVPVDNVEYKCFSLSATKKNSDIGAALYSGFYNKNKFWFPTNDAFFNNIDSQKKQLLNFVNLSQAPVTILVRKANKKDIKKFDILAKNWYGGVNNVPKFMDPMDYISDYFIEVILLDGDFSNYAALALDPIMSEFFHSTRGLIKSKLDKFLQLKEVNILGRYIGSVIPNFTDSNGNNIFIADIINNDVLKTGIYCAIDTEAFSDILLSGIKDGVDIIGHNIENELNNNNNFNDIEFLSYKMPVKEDNLYNNAYDVNNLPLKSLYADIAFLQYSYDNSTWQTSPLNIDDSNKVLYIKIPYTYNTSTGDYLNISDIKNGISKKSYIRAIDTSNPSNDKFLFKVSEVIDNNSEIIIKIEYDYDSSIININSFTIVNSTNNIEILENLNFITEINSSDNFLYSQILISGTNGYLVINDNDSTHQLYNDIINGKIISDDIIYNNSNNKFNILIDYRSYNGSYNNNFIVLSTWKVLNNINLKMYAIINKNTSQSLPSLGNINNSTGNPIPNNQLNIVSNIELLDYRFQYTYNTSLSNTNEIIVDLTQYPEADGKIIVGDYLIAQRTGTNGETRLTRINKITKNGNNLIIKTDEAIDVTLIFQARYRNIEEVIEYYKLYKLEGFKINTAWHSVNGTQERINELYDYALNPNNNLYKALKDKDTIQYSYIVDGFGLGIMPESKYQLARLAQDRDNVLAILNAPSIKDFMNSLSPYFKNADGSLNTRFIVEGGDLSRYPAFLYTLPNDENGASYAAFYAPYLKIRERGQDIYVPPAGLVSNLYIKKYTQSLPWAIVAGKKRGVITGVNLIGVEYNFTLEDRENLEPFGINPIIVERGTGIVIKGNSTASQRTFSALSNIHVREVINYIKNGLTDILKNYVFQFNTPQTRLEIKTLADKFLAQVQSDGGIYDFRNIIDTTNNTPDVIDNNMAILDTYIEPVRGAQIIINRITILRTGAIASGGI